MMFFVVLLSAVSLICATTQLPQYEAIATTFGDPLDFVISNDVQYPADWQRASGDPHGQGAPSQTSNDTLCWDFAGSASDNLKYMLWENTDFEVVSKMVARPTDEVGRPDLRTSIEELYFMTVSAAITVTINANEITIEFEGSATNYNWNTAFHVVLPSGAGTVTSTVDSIDVTLTFGTYEFRVRSVGDFLCVTLVDGDVDILDGLMGQLHTYTIYSSAATAMFGPALAVVNGNAVSPFLVTKTHHVGLNKVCWYYQQTGSTHAVFGDINDYLYA